MTRVERLNSNPESSTVDDVLYLLRLVERRTKALQDILEVDGDNTVYSIHGIAGEGLKEI